MRRMKMDFSMAITFALLQISIQPAEVDSSPHFPAEDSPAESSHHHHHDHHHPDHHHHDHHPDHHHHDHHHHDHHPDHHHPDHHHHDHHHHVHDKNVFQSTLEWKEVDPPEVPEDAVPVFDKKLNQTFYIARLEDCTPCFFDSAHKSCQVIEMHAGFSLGNAVQNGKISFLVNKDQFEILEWKKSSYGEIPALTVETCKGYFIAQNEFGLGYMTENSLITIRGEKKDITENEILTLNHDIKGHHLNIIKYEMNQANTSESIKELKHFMVSNKNCATTKYQVRLDQGIDKTISLLKTRSLLFGGNVAISAGGDIIVAKAEGKVDVKLEHSRLNSETTSTTNKDLHSVNIEVQVLANHVCSIDMKGNTFTADIPVTAELTRIYNNNKVRKTLISDTYSHQEVAEIQALASCVLLSDEKMVKCQNL